MTRGLVIGKFYPPHKGHKYLIDTARQGVDFLSVIVCSKADQTIPAQLRAQWLRDIHPDIDEIKIIESTDDELPEDDSKAWADATIDWLGYSPDIVYTSESYGDAYAAYMGSEHVSVDKFRSKFPISGTEVRTSPLAHSEFLEPIVRQHFVKRICVLGAESTGTTTISQALAEHYKTEWVPEYGRTYTEQKYAKTKDPEWSSDEFAHIATTQNTQEDEAALAANKLLICDTNSLVTNVWHQHFMGSSSDQVAKLADGRTYDLYLITSPDFPFVQDGFREDDAVRQQMHNQFIELLNSQNLPYVLLSGSHKQRLRTASRSIDQLIQS